MNRVALFGLELDPLGIDQAVAQLWQWIEQPAGACRYVVTPNVDHVVMFQANPELRVAYRDAALVLADGKPVVWAARLLRAPLRCTVPGSDLTPALFAAARSERPLRIFLLGAAPGVGERAAANIHAQWPAARVVGVYSPPLGFERDAAECDRIVTRINDARPDVLVVGLGAPKQELWVHRHRARLSTPVALCVGATIDFLAGEKHRAPVWMRRVGLEWLHRVASEPRRLAKRYARDAWIFPQLVWRQWRAAR